MIPYKVDRLADHPPSVIAEKLLLLLEYCDRITESLRRLFMLPYKLERLADQPLRNR